MSPIIDCVLDACLPRFLQLGISNNYPLQLKCHILRPVGGRSLLRIIPPALFCRSGWHRPWADNAHSGPWSDPLQSPASSVHMFGTTVWPAATRPQSQDPFQIQLSNERGRPRSPLPRQPSMANSSPTTVDANTAHHNDNYPK